VQASSYTPNDAQVLTHIPYVAEFSLTCSNAAAANNAQLYADIEGKLVPVVRSQDAGGRYQLSWTKEVKHAKTGDHEVNLYDEEGYYDVKKARDRGEGSTVKPLVTIIVNYPGAYKGPWVNSELLAAALSILVFYLAYTSKAALLA
jgi:translocon-associated protein subunit delta